MIGEIFGGIERDLVDILELGAQPMRMQSTLFKF